MKSIIPANAVGDRVGKHDVLETTGRDLEVIIWITPRSKAVVVRIRKESGMVRVRRV